MCINSTVSMLHGLISVLWFNKFHKDVYYIENRPIKPGKSGKIIDILYSSYIYVPMMILCSYIER